jgi:Asp-tRNA(Asn)/Glu-tRNA(Gln) amidotransferase A subunit family amidase
LSTRRDAIATLIGAAAAPALSSAAQGSGAVTSDWKVSAATISELEHVHVLPLTEVGRQRLIDSVAQNIVQVRTLRAVAKQDLKPALHFDPRLPGKRYGPQPNHVRLVGKLREKLPQDAAEIAFASVREQAHWLRSGQLTSLALTDIYLARIARIDPALKSFITLTADLARSQARAADRELGLGTDRGPLHGIPYGIKDLLDTAGIRTTWGAAPFKDRIPAEDATIVRLLREAGSPLLGKLSTGALGHGHVWLGNKTRNPWNVEETSGGSSAGPGSATSAGLVSYSIGTDGSGSIINPADRCGVVGLRPSFGRVSRRGSMSSTPSFSRAGPMTRTIEDAVLILAALNGQDPELPDFGDIGFSYDGALDLSQLKVGFARAAFDVAGPLHRGVLDAVSALGAQVSEVELPRLPYDAILLTMSVESAAFFEELTLSNADEAIDFGDLNPGAPANYRRARMYSAVDYLQADRLRRLAMQQWHELFDQVDVIIGPAYGPSGAVGALSLTGHPGLTFRIGFVESPTRRPAVDQTKSHRVTQNITMHARMFEEGRMLALARALEEKFGVWRERPPTG